MNCKKIRELIITDYIDQEATEAVQKEILAHLKVCAGCKAFEQTLREKASDPLKKAQPLEPPESIWQRIQETIDAEELYSPSFLRRLADFLSGALLAHKPTVAFSAALVVVLISVWFVQAPFSHQRVAKSYLREQSDYMLSMSAPINGELESDTSFGTAIENVFF